MTSRLPLPKFEAISIKKNATVTLKNAIIDNFKNLINIQNRGQEASDKFIVENVCAHVSDNLIEYHTAGKVKDLLNEVYSKKLNVVNEQIVNDFSSPKNFDFGYDESLKIENVSKN